MSMTPEEAIRMFEAKAECNKRETSGTDSSCNNRKCDECDLNYMQGNMDEQRESLYMEISALHAQDVPDINFCDMVSRQKAIDILDAYQVMVENGEENPYAWARQRMSELQSAQPDCIECIRKIDNYGEEHYIGDNDKMFWDIRSILENPKHFEVSHYGESTEIVKCKNCVNWIPGQITEHDDFIPPKCGKYQQMVGHSSDDYCSLAERITDEQSN